MQKEWKSDCFVVCKFFMEIQKKIEWMESNLNGILNEL